MSDWVTAAFFPLYWNQEHDDSSIHHTHNVSDSADWIWLKPRGMIRPIILLRLIHNYSELNYRHFTSVVTEHIYLQDFWGRRINGWILVWLTQQEGQRSTDTTLEQTHTWCFAKVDFSLVGEGLNSDLLPRWAREKNLRSVFDVSRRHDLISQTTLKCLLSSPSSSLLSSEMGFILHWPSSTRTHAAIVPRSNHCLPQLCLSVVFRREAFTFSSCSSTESDAKTPYAHIQEEKYQGTMAAVAQR